VSENSKGLRSILSNPRVYSGIRDILGLNRWLKKYVADFIQPSAGARVLDIGCGPGEIVRYLGQVDYTGVDRNASYIEYAAEHFSGLGKFVCADVADHIDEFTGEFDIVTANGLLHHLDDDLASRLFEIGHTVLRPGGRMITVDPCFHEGQSSLARFIIRNDRGQNVRSPEEYAALAAHAFPDHDKKVWDGYVPIPFSVTIVQCRKPVAAR